MRFNFRGFRFPMMAAAMLVLSFSSVRADWQRTDTGLAWAKGDKVVWKFSFDSKAGKPFFYPLSINGGTSLINFKPEDHPWHYGLWFSWKYINHVNYWEEDRTSGRAEGATCWTTPLIEITPEGGATIRLTVSYIHPSGRVELTEQREIRVNAPSADGGYTLDWRAHFTAGTEGVLLDRTPMPNEPEGKFNGGYGGLAIRLVSAPLSFAAVSTHAFITHYEQERNRPNAAAVAFNIADGATQIGSVAIVSAPANAGAEAPWYIVNSTQMRFACAAVLAPKPLHYAPGAQWELNYRIILRPAPWTPEALSAVATEVFPSASK